VKSAVSLLNFGLPETSADDAGNKPNAPAVDIRKSALLM